MGLTLKLSFCQNPILLHFRGKAQILMHILSSIVTYELYTWKSLHHHNSKDYLLDALRLKKLPNTNLFLYNLFISHFYFFLFIILLCAATLKLFYLKTFSDVMHAYFTSLYLRHILFLFFFFRMFIFIF